MTRKILSALTLALVTVFSLTAAAYTPTEDEIRSLVWDKIIPANPKFANVDLIQPGDTIVVPVDGGDSAIYFARFKENMPVNTDGIPKHDCMWRVAERHLTMYGPSLAITPVPSTSPALTTPAITPTTPSLPATAPATVVKAGFDSWSWWYLLVLVPMAIWLGYNYLRQRDPNTHPPVMLNGMADNRDGVVTNITNYYPNHVANGVTITKVERGFLQRRKSWQWKKEWPFAIQFDIKPPLHVDMMHGDGVKRVKYLHSNDPIVKVTYSDDSIKYYRSACGNYSTLIVPNEVKVDEYVEFVPQTPAAQAA